MSLARLGQDPEELKKKQKGRRDRYGKTLEESQEKQTEALDKGFERAETQLRGQKEEAGRAMDEGFDRMQARVGTLGGSVTSERERQKGELAKDFAEAQGSLEANKAQAYAALENQATQQKLQVDQYLDTMDFQEGSFAQQMEFQWAEFDENLKTNLLNAAISMKDAGLRSSEDWARLLDSLEAFGYDERIDTSGFERERNQPAPSLTPYQQNVNRYNRGF